MPLAFFDLDGTLTKYDTLFAYCLIVLLRRPWRILGIKFLIKGCCQFLRGNIGRDQLKEAITFAFLRGLTKKDIGCINKSFLAFVLPLNTRGTIYTRMREHQSQGYRVFIVSASPDIYVESIAKHWNLEGAICTTLEWKNGRLTGRLMGRNCRGEEKAKRILTIFCKKDLEGSFAYGNSHDDWQLLQLAAFGMRI